ncbi:putative myosin-13-like isoform X2 [Capsicum annuum]|uniref:Uncharacterized protein n=1 Tax=Capsicum annuum TaxID=4072 RepID=A0A1U8DR89_CAPAN|nr:uncharacterized protein LOC107838818 [Capsicum annuum]KAF3635875.1 putative myosin-13-like isoform X2 [Capsicum annuum]KAF3650415.1 putative myosin-13-like isoform X2 [Capsicum annuum]PHT74044.1 hypothetical protein T459_21321 [Capsicum annuum]
MSRLRINSSPDLMFNTSEQFHDDSALEGVAANIKLLLKLTQEHKDSCNKEKNDGRRMLRVATMMTILDNVRTRIKKCQSFGNKSSSEAESNSHVPIDKKYYEPMIDEKEKLRKQLNASLAARKSLEVMCSSLGKEKEIMAAELSKKVHELNEMEDLINDLKEKNENLVGRLHERATEQKERRYSSSGGESQGNSALQERNKALSENLLRSLDGYRSIKRKWKDAQAENMAMHATMEEMTAKIGAGLARIQSFKERIASESVPSTDIKEDIVELEHMFECFEMQVAKHGPKEGECVQSKVEISASKPTVFA